MKMSLQLSRAEYNLLVCMYLSGGWARRAWEVIPGDSDFTDFRKYWHSAVTEGFPNTQRNLLKSSQ